MKTSLAHTKIAAWSVHLLTASGALIALLTLNQIYHHQYVSALWLMALSIFVDAIDGALARWARVKIVLPQIDGALLDNIIDYLNYVVIPCFFLLIEPELLNGDITWLVLGGILLSSAYQFTQSDAKTPDHFFKGFPCYWNLAVFYLYLFKPTSLTCAMILLTLCLLVFVPIKYVYPSRLDFLTASRKIKNLMVLASFLYGISCLLMLYMFPVIAAPVVIYSICYVIFYLTFSLYRTFVPLAKME